MIFSIPYEDLLFVNFCNLFIIVITFIKIFNYFYNLLITLKDINKIRFFISFKLFFFHILYHIFFFKILNFIVGPDIFIR